MDCRPHSKGNLGLKAMASSPAGHPGWVSETYLSLSPALPMTSSVNLGKKLSFHIYKIRMLSSLNTPFWSLPNMVCLC